jgi:hypothetical protein
MGVDISVRSFLFIGATSVSPFPESVSFEVKCKNMSDLSALEELPLRTLLAVGCGLFQAQKRVRFPLKVYTLCYNELKIKGTTSNIRKQNNFRLDSKSQNFYVFIFHSVPFVTHTRANLCLFLKHTFKALVADLFSGNHCKSLITNNITVSQLENKFKMQM